MDAKLGLLVAGVLIDPLPRLSEVASQRPDLPAPAAEQAATSFR
jgi:hypothetical protein